MLGQSASGAPVSVSSLRAMKAEGSRIACLTAYDRYFRAAAR